jgi:hypothetical protein
MLLRPAAGVFRMLSAAVQVALSSTRDAVCWSVPNDTLRWPAARTTRRVKMKGLV